MDTMLKSREKKWVSRIVVDGKQIHIGYFKDLLTASESYKSAADKYHREFACY
jgi:hypothetical protein